MARTKQTARKAPAPTMEPSIEISKEDLHKILRPRVYATLEGAVSSLDVAVSPSAMPIEDAAAWLQSAALLLNKTEIENVVFHFGSEDGTVDIAGFLEFLGPPASVPGNSFATEAPMSPHKSHLALSGVSHVEFGKQFKEFPARWGAPPNATVKGHDGVVRDLPGGYGMGNGPLHKWVALNMEKDATSQIDMDGQNPFLYGGYSYGCSAPKGGYIFSMSNP